MIENGIFCNRVGACQGSDLRDGVEGRRQINHLLTKNGVEIIAGVDINPTIVGKDLGEVLGREKL